MRRLILDTAIEILLREGAVEVTAARVAQAAGVARTTIYRQWPDQRSLLLATIDGLTAPHGPVDEPGHTLDVGDQLRRLRTRLEVRDVRSVFGALASHSARDSAFASAQHRFVDRLTEPMQRHLRAAQEATLLAADMDCELEAELLVGAVLHRHLARHEPVPDDFIDAIEARWRSHHGLAAAQPT